MQRIGSQFGASGVQTSQRRGRVFLTRCSTIVESRLQHPFFDASVSNGIVSFIHHTVAFPMSIARLLHCSFWNLRSLVAPAIRSEKPLALGSDDRLGYRTTRRQHSIYFQASFSAFDVSAPGFRRSQTLRIHHGIDNAYGGYYPSKGIWAPRPSHPSEWLTFEQLTEALNPTTLEIHNDSHLHAHHKAMQGVTSREVSSYQPRSHVDTG
jgi:hypothetical protein